VALLQALEVAGRNEVDAGPVVSQEGGKGVQGLLYGGGQKGPRGTMFLVARRLTCTFSVFGAWRPGRYRPTLGARPTT